MVSIRWYLGSLKLLKGSRGVAGLGTVRSFAVEGYTANTEYIPQEGRPKVEAPHGPILLMFVVLSDLCLCWFGDSLCQ